MVVLSAYEHILGKTLNVLDDVNEDAFEKIFSTLRPGMPNIHLYRCYNES